MKRYTEGSVSCLLNDSNVFSFTDERNIWSDNMHSAQFNESHTVQQNFASDVHCCCLPNILPDSTSILSDFHVQYMV